MSNESAISTSCGGGIASTITIVFVILKLVHVIDWSWWWVFAPIWIPMALAMLFILFAYGMFLLTDS